MYYTASLQMYDALADVIWVVQVREWNWTGDESTSEPVLRLTGRLPSEGLGNPTRWLKRALEDIRESL